MKSALAEARARYRQAQLRARQEDHDLIDALRELLGMRPLYYQGEQAESVEASGAAYARDWLPRLPSSDGMATRRGGAQ